MGNVPSAAPRSGSDAGSDAAAALAARARLPRAVDFAAFFFPVSVASSVSAPHAAATPSFAIAAAVSSAVGRHDSAKDSRASDDAAAAYEVRHRIGIAHASAPEGSYPAAANSASLAPNAHSREDAGSVATRKSHRAVAGSSGRIAGRSGEARRLAAAKASASHPLATISRRTSARATVGSAPRRAAPFAAASTKGARSDGTGVGQSMGGANGSGAAPGASGAGMNAASSKARTASDGYGVSSITSPANASSNSAALASILRPRASAPACCWRMAAVASSERSMSRRVLVCRATFFSRCSSSAFSRRRRAMVDPEPRAAGAAASASLGRFLPSTLETRLRAREAASVGLAVKSKSDKISSEIPLGTFSGEREGAGGGFAEGLRPGRDPERASTSISQSSSSSSSVRSPGVSSRAIVGVPRASVCRADLKSDAPSNERRSERRAAPHFLKVVARDWRERERERATRRAPALAPSLAPTLAPVVASIVASFRGRLVSARPTTRHLSSTLDPRRVVLRRLSSLGYAVAMTPSSSSGGLFGSSRVSASTANPAEILPAPPPAALAA